MDHATPDGEQLMTDFLAVTNEQDYAKLSDVVSDSFVWRTPAAPGGEVQGPDNAADVVRAVTGAFSDFEAELLDVLVSEDVGMAEVRFTGTHEGEFMGVEPTGRDIELPAMSVWHVDDGHIQELRGYANMQDILGQLGALDEQK